MNFDRNYLSKALKRLFSLALTTILLYFALKLSIFYLPFLISFFLALLIEPIIKFLMKRLKWTRRISSIIVISFVILIVFGIVGWGITTLFKEASKIIDDSDKYLDKIKNIMDQI